MKKILWCIGLVLIFSTGLLAQNSRYGGDSGGGTSLTFPDSINAQYGWRPAFSTPTTGDSLWAIRNGVLGFVEVNDLPTGAGGQINTASNLGGGLSNYDSKVVADLRFNTFLATDFDLGSNVISIDRTLSANWVTGTHTFSDDLFQWQNPAATFQYIVNTSAIAADREITLPLLTGDDTFTFNDFAATLQNKIIDGGSNTITGIGLPEIETDGVGADELNASAVESELEAVIDIPDLQGQVSDSQIADGAVDGGPGGEITDGSVGSVDADSSGADGLTTNSQRFREPLFQVTIDIPDSAETDTIPIWDNYKGSTVSLDSIIAKTHTDDYDLIFVRRDENGANPTRIDSFRVADNGSGVFTHTETSLSVSSLPNTSGVWLVRPNDDGDFIKFLFFGSWP